MGSPPGRSSVSRHWASMASSCVKSLVDGKRIVGVTDAVRSAAHCPPRVLSSSLVNGILIYARCRVVRNFDVASIHAKICATVATAHLAWRRYSLTLHAPVVGHQFLLQSLVELPIHLAPTPAAYSSLVDTLQPTLVILEIALRAPYLWQRSASEVMLC